MVMLSKKKRIGIYLLLIEPQFFILLPVLIKLFFFFAYNSSLKFCLKI